MRPAPKRGALPTALWLLRSGLWPVAISAQSDTHAGSPGKSPIGRAWGQTRATREKLLATFARHNGAGVGIALGPEAGVVDLEVDDPEQAAPLLKRLVLPETLGWRSARGDHRLYGWERRLPELTSKAIVYLAGGGVELRLGGAGKQVVAVCPPTVGSDRRRRRWNGVWEVAPLPACLLDEIARGRIDATDRRPVVLPPSGHGAVPYAAAALAAEAELVRSAPPGTRNRTLNRAAFSLGQLVGMGTLDRSVVEAELAAAARDSGLPEGEVASTLQSGIEAGIRTPRRRLAPPA